MDGGIVKAFLISIMLHLVLLCVLYTLIPHRQNADMRTAVSVELLKEKIKRVPRKVLRKKVVSPIPPESKPTPSRTIPRIERPKIVEENALWSIDVPEDLDQYSEESLTISLPLRSVGFEWNPLKRRPVERPIQRHIEFEYEVKEETFISLPLTDSIPSIEALPLPLPRESLDAFLKEVRRRIEENKFYPPEARETGLEGTVLILFEILENGEVGEIKVISSSGHPTLDMAGVQAIRRASPFPKLSSYTYRKRLQIKVPITFKIE